MSQKTRHFNYPKLSNQSVQNSKKYQNYTYLEDTTSKSSGSKTSDEGGIEESFLGFGDGDCRCDCSDVKPSQPIKVKSYTMRNDNRMTVKVITWGATIVSIKTPDKYGDPIDIVMGFDDIKSQFMFMYLIEYGYNLVIFFYTIFRNL